MHKKRAVRLAGDGPSDEKKDEPEARSVDNRKVVVEDLLYLDDLEVLIYTTVAPKTSSVFITSAKKPPAEKSGDSST